MVIAVVMITGFLRVIQFSIQISLQYIIYLSMTSPDDWDTMSRKLVVGPHAHIASQHQGYSHLLHDRSNIRLATTPLRRVQTFLVNNLILFSVKTV